MTVWGPARSVRTRLALWHAATLGVVLTAYAAGVFVFVRHVLSDELTRQLHDDYEALEGRLQTTRAGIQLSESRHPGEPDEPQPWAEIWAADGHNAFRTADAARAAVSQPPRAQATGYTVESVVASTGEHLRTMSERVSLPPEVIVLRVARSEEPFRHELRELLIGMVVAFPLAIVLATVGGARLARRALLPVERMAERARTITAERLQDRLPVDNPHDELGQLATVFNETLTRLERSFHRLRRFTADASHELRTPLTAIRSVGEVGLSERHGEAAYRDIIGSMLEDADRLTRLVDTLLTLSRADAGQFILQKEKTDLGGLVRQVVSDLFVLAEDKRQSLTVEAPELTEVIADPVVLSEAIVNLVDNAIKYSPDEAEVLVVVRRTAAGAEIDVIDHGPGIPDDHRDRIFDRFYRVDTARTRNPGGSGLGLSIAQWAVQAHHGQLIILSTGSSGTTFRITLPAAG